MEDEITIESLKLTAETVMKRGTNGNKLIRIPPKLYQANPKAFIPQLVSIGPFHHLGHNFDRFKDVNILAMEGKKRMYLLEAVKSEERTLEACKNFLNEKCRDVRDCYSEETDMSEDMLLNIMLVDACFILRQLVPEGVTVTVIDHAAGRYPRDLALFENQIPFFVLEGLFSICYPTMQNSDLKKRLLQLFQLTLEIPSLSSSDLNEQDCSHLLDLISKCHRPHVIRPLGITVWSVIDFPMIHMMMNATRLAQAGVTFQCVSQGKLLVLEFSKGVLRMTPLMIHDSTETILTNLLAYEHLSPNDRPYFTSYVAFMSHLIQSQQDLQLLERKGIIVNMLGCKDEAAKIFSNVSKQFLLTDFCYRDLCREIFRYTDTRWRRYVQDLINRCFISPWTTISVLAASLLLILSALQTIYSVLSYYHLG